MTDRKPLGAMLWKGLAVDQLTETGTFRGYLSTWDVDKDNERFEKGSYTRSIFEYVAAGVMPAVLWQHDTVRRGSDRHRAFDTANIVGRLTSMKEDDRGLLVTGRIDLSTDRGKLVYAALKTGVLSMSVGFAAHHWHDEDGVKTFDEVEILEATLTPNPANPEAVILEVKATSDDWARVRQHLRNSHAGFSTVDTSSRTTTELLTLHRLAHAEIPASPEHLRNATTDGNVEITSAAKSELDAYKRKINELAAPTRRAKSDAEVRAAVNRLYDEHVLAEQLEQLKADAALFDARVRRREREERQRAIWRTEAWR
jgi:HK97 family phage prohead protease